jgi:CDP-4-dehydro-6-deoxyglucose reductase/ferredoxin-NAD(P)+ reductase (naphthalene dioxygenase ferredoxin-specific)
MAFKVTIANAGTTVECAPDKTVLTAAVLAGIDFPYGCATGNCAQCICELRQGKVELLPHGDGALSARQKAAGLTLACRAQPRSDVVVHWLGTPLKG